MTKSKFNIGDNVRIINYGGSYFIYKNEYFKFSESGKAPKNVLYEDDDIFVIDSCPEEVGNTGIVRNITFTGKVPDYALTKRGKAAWFNENQLELV